MTQPNSKPVYTAWIRLDFDQATFKLDITGEFASLDVGMAMLQQAMRELEVQQRMARAAQMQRAAQEQREVDALTHAITRKV
jgi:GTP-sensing pleiotropic transcriptional regulator CodY